MAISPHATRPARGTCSQPQRSSRSQQEDQAPEHCDYEPGSACPERSQSGPARRKDWPLRSTTSTQLTATEPPRPVTASRPVRGKSLSRQRSAQCRAFRSIERSEDGCLAWPLANCDGDADMCTCRSVLPFGRVRGRVTVRLRREARSGSVVFTTGRAVRSGASLQLADRQVSGEH